MFGNKKEKKENILTMVNKYSQGEGAYLNLSGSDQ